MGGMSSDAGGFDPAAPPPPPAYAPNTPPFPSPAGYPVGQPTQDYGPPPGYAPPGYGPPPGYPPPGYYAAPPYQGVPGYQGFQQAPGYYPPQGYGPTRYPPAVKPGIIPLRPLGLSDIFNASVSYIRSNPKATLGLTVIVIVIAQIVSVLIQIGPLTSTGILQNTGSVPYGSSDVSDSEFIGLMLSSTAGIITTAVAAIVLSGLLTVVIGRAVFGASIGVGEAWRRVRGRLLPLFGVTALEMLGAALLIAALVGVIVAVDEIASGPAAFIVGLLFGLALVVLLVYLYTMLIFAPTLVVLERIGIWAAVTRSFALVKNDFWRVFGISLLGVVVAGFVSGAVTVPFSIVGQIMLLTGDSTTTSVVAIVIITVGGAIGQIITAPFNAGVVVLLYTDRRIRAEAFDLVLQTGAAGPVASTDDLWLTPHR